MTRLTGAGWMTLGLVTLLGVPAGALRTTIGGRLIELNGTAEVREVFEVDRDTTHDRTQELLRLRLGAELADWLRFDSTTVGSNGGPTFKATKGGTFNFNDAFQDINPSVEFEEAYFDAHFESVDVRIGKQKLAWGKLDRSQPNDLFNPERYVDPLMQEEDERKIGIPAVQGSYYLTPGAWIPEEARFTAVWAPMYVPFRFPVAGERWFPPAATPPSTFQVPGGILPLPGGETNPPFSVPVSFRAVNINPPARQFRNSSWNARLSGFVGGVDAALYYFHGFDPSPAFRLDAVAFGEYDPNPNNPIGVKNLSAETQVRPVYRNIDAWGADAAYTLGDVTVRAEGAYVSGRAFSRDLRFLVDDPRTLVPQIAAALRAFQQGATQAPIDLGQSFIVSDAVEWGVGADYTLAGYFMLLQLNQTDILNDRGVDLLIKETETRLLANLRKNFFGDDLEAQLLGTYGISSDYSVLLPRLTYHLTDAIDVRAGYLFIAGRSRSVGGQYKHNDQGFLRLRYTF